MKSSNMRDLCIGVATYGHGRSSWQTYWDSVLERYKPKQSKVKYRVKGQPKATSLTKSTVARWLKAQSSHPHHD